MPEIRVFIAFCRRLRKSSIAMRSPEGPRVLFVDDDIYAMQRYVEHLLDAGYSVSPATSADQAIDLARIERFDAVILDIAMPPGKNFSLIETAGGYKTGIALARELRQLLPDTRFLAHTISRDPEIEEWFTSDESVAFLAKPALPRTLLRRLASLLRQGQDPPRVFIVHGRDEVAVQELKALLQIRMGFPEPIVLAEQPSRGLTLIEKFEQYAADSDLAFVLFTPDDIGYLSGAPDSPSHRPRMNVLFELGYFLGALRRRSGRVFLLKKGSVKVPSDIAGVVYIDISPGVESAARVIQQELADWL